MNWNLFFMIVGVGACHRRAVGRVVDGEGVALPVGELLIAGVVDDEVAVDFIEGGDPHEKA